jgi:predicted MFS family arabinose efflux permease
VSAVSFVAYRGLLAEPVLRRLAVADACVRLPQGMVSITVLLVDAALSATEVAVTGYVRHHHALWASGPLLAEVSIGCILGSLLLGPRSRSLPAMTAGFAGGLALLTAAGLDAPLLAVAAPLAGLFLGPVLATLFGAAAAAAPSGSGTETQAWLNSIMNGGAAAGAAIAGAVLSGAGASRPILALALACALALGAAASAAVGGARTIAGARAGPVR